MVFQYTMMSVEQLWHSSTAFVLGLKSHRLDSLPFPNVVIHQRIYFPLPHPCVSPHSEPHSLPYHSYQNKYFLAHIWSTSLTNIFHNLFVQQSLGSQALRLKIQHYSKVLISQLTQSYHAVILMSTAHRGRTVRNRPISALPSQTDVSLCPSLTVLMLFD